MIYYYAKCLQNKSAYLKKYLKRIFLILKKIFRLLNVIVSSLIALKHNLKKNIYILILCSIYN